MRTGDDRATVFFYANCIIYLRRGFKGCSNLESDFVPKLIQKNIIYRNINLVYKLLTFK